MRHFLVHTVVTLPEGETVEIAALREQEISRSHDLQRAGVLITLWRESGRLASFGLWRGEDEDDVRARIDTLPFRRHMSVSVREVEAHPNALHAFPFTTN